MMRRFVLVLAALLVGLPAGARELAGVSLPDTITVNGTPLVLNGMGIRKKLWVKVYVGAIYAEQRSSDPAKIITPDTPKQMVMSFLYKEVEAAKLVEGWREGFANNSAAALPALQQRLDTFCALWPAMKSGEKAVMTYIPGTGTEVEINGKVVGVIPGKDFSDALFAVWVGDKPPTPDFKDGVLGK